MRTLIEMAHEVYGEHTFWTEAQLLRLKELERLVRADERERLKASIALDKMAENARDLGLDYEPAVQERNFCERCGKRLGGDGHIHTCTLPAAQPAVQERRDWSLLEATQESLREHMAEIKRLKAAQPEIKLKGKNHG
jgi:molybdenum cofactor biosynthesis enzyme MoaA